MRLRLRIERNELPSVNILWAIRDTDLRQTVAQFLERVNDRFPLEGESWGLEDYAVTVDGYEALHYNEVGTAFQNEDEVVVKPLQFVDVRARTMTGMRTRKNPTTCTARIVPSTAGSTFTSIVFTRRVRRRTA